MPAAAAVLDAPVTLEIEPAPGETKAAAAPALTSEGAWGLDRELPPRLLPFAGLIGKALERTLPAVKGGKVEAYRAHADAPVELIDTGPPMLLTKCDGSVWRVYDANRMVLTVARDYCLLWDKRDGTERAKLAAPECLAFLKAAAREWDEERKREAI